MFDELNILSFSKKGVKHQKTPTKTIRRRIVSKLLSTVRKLKDNNKSVR